MAVLSFINDKSFINDSVIVRLINDSFLKTWGRMYAPRGRDEIKSTSPAFCSQKAQLSHTTGIRNHPFYRLVLLDSFTNLLLSFGKGDGLPNCEAR